MDLLEKIPITVREEYNPYPDILSFVESGNVYLHSPNAEYDIPFAMNKDSIMDIDILRNFLKNAEYRFRSSREYKAYKDHLMRLGLTNSSVHSNLNSEMCSIEMHHCILSLFDIALMITWHMVNTVGHITSFDLVQLLILEHRQNNIPVIMLDETSHQMYHSEFDAYFPPEMIFGKWLNLLARYSNGITIDIAKKIIFYIQKYYNNTNPMCIELRNSVLSYANYNEYGYQLDDKCKIPTNLLEDKSYGSN